MEETVCFPWFKLWDSKHISSFWSHQRADPLQRSSPLLSAVRTSPLGLGRTLLEEYDVLFHCFFVFFLHLTAPLWYGINIYVCIGLEGTIFYLRWIRMIRERSLFKVKNQIWSPTENGSETVKSRRKLLFIHSSIPLIRFPLIVKPPSLLEIKLSEDWAIFKLCGAARKPGGEEAGRPGVRVCVCEPHRLLDWIDGLGYDLPQLESLTASFILHERMWRTAVGKQPYTPWKTITRLCGL